MTLAIDIDGCDFVTNRIVSNAVLAIQVRAFNQLYITNKMECFSYKSGRAMWVVELIKEDWPVVLQ